MKMMTKEIEAKMAPLYSTENSNGEAMVQVKFFDIAGSWTWYAWEAEKQENGDWLFFGLVDGFEKEMGYFTMSELQSVKWGSAPRIERDMYWTPITVNELMSSN